MLKDLRITKKFKEIKFQGFWGKVELKKVSERIIHKIFESNSSFHIK